MVHTHKWKELALSGTVALGVSGLALVASAAPIPKDTVITSYADDNGPEGDPQIVLLTKDGDPTGFAHVDTADDRKWIAPIGFGPDGHLYLAEATNNGTLLDLTATDGGDRTGANAKPLATKIFPVLPHKISGMAFDAEGNVYLSLSEAEDSTDNGNPYPISKVELKTGKVSSLKGSVDHAKGLAIGKNADGKEILYIVEGNTGKVLTYNLTDDQPGDKPFVTGFPGILDHGMGQIAIDPRGKLFLSWQMDPSDRNTGAIFDISNGGDFSDFTKTPPVLMASQFGTDVNGLAFDSKNNMYVGGDNHFTFVSAFDPATSKFADFEQYANDNGGGDSESVTVAP
jgi:hypothetical protein